MTLDNDILQDIRVNYSLSRICHKTVMTFGIAESALSKLIEEWEDNLPSDMHLAYLEGKNRGYSEFILYGGVGGRPDHTFANYCLLSYIRSDGATAVLHGDGNIAFVIKNEATRVMGKQGNHISVFAFGGKAEGVFIKGLCYGLENGSLSPSFPLGVSNSFTDTEGEISVSRGTLLIISEI